MTSIDYRAAELSLGRDYAKRLIRHLNDEFSLAADVTEGEDGKIAVYLKRTNYTLYIYPEGESWVARITDAGNKVATLHKSSIHEAAHEGWSQLAFYDSAAAASIFLKEELL